MDTAILLTPNALLSSAAAVIMLVVLRTRKTYPGFAFWTMGVACLALGAGMLVPDLLPQAWATAAPRLDFPQPATPMMTMEFIYCKAWIALSEQGK